MEDKRDILKESPPFAWKVTKDGKVLVYWDGRIVRTLTGQDASRFMPVLEAGDAYQIQLYLARFTGNFKRGNER